MMITDAIGRVVWQQTVGGVPEPSADAQLFVIPLIHFPAGLYPILLRTEQGTVRKVLLVSEL